MTDDRALYGEQFGEQPYGSAPSDSAAPVVIAVEPGVGDVFVDLYTVLRLLVPRDVVDGWTVELDRGDGFELALSYPGAAVFESAFDGAESELVAETGHYRVAIDPVEIFDAMGEVTVRVTGEDAAGNLVIVV